MNCEEKDKLIASNESMKQVEQLKQHIIYLKSQVSSLNNEIISRDVKIFKLKHYVEVEKVAELEKLIIQNRDVDDRELVKQVSHLERRISYYERDINYYRAFLNEITLFIEAGTDR